MDYYRKDWVSILVLMEVLREVRPPSTSMPFSSRFNPCFNGSVERGQIGHESELVRGPKFQSLF